MAALVIMIPLAALGVLVETLMILSGAHSSSVDLALALEIFSRRAKNF